MTELEIADAEIHIDPRPCLEAKLVAGERLLAKADGIPWRGVGLLADLDDILEAACPGAGAKRQERPADRKFSHGYAPCSRFLPCRSLNADGRPIEAALLQFLEGSGVGLGGDASST